MRNAVTLTANAIHKPFKIFWDMLKCRSSMRAICCMARSSAIDVKVPPISKFIVQIICRTHSHHGDNCTAKMTNEFLPGGLLNSLHNLTPSYTILHNQHCTHKRYVTPIPAALSLLTISCTIVRLPSFYLCRPVPW